MLYLYFRGSEPAEIPVVTNVESAFLWVKFEATEENKALVQKIEQGTLVDRTAFIDRMGYRLYTECLSTGCKAALLVQNTDKLIDLRECGLNAINVIFSTCKSGRVLMDSPSLEFEGEGTPIEIMLDGRVFYDVKQLNDYVGRRGLDD